MANEKHVALLRDEGVSAWNLFREKEENREIQLDLSAADLSGRNLANANLDQTNLREANLSNAILENARLVGADLSEANLSSANLKQATLLLTRLEKANLSGANLEYCFGLLANFCGATLTGASCAAATLTSANLSDANLCDANLVKADLHDANLSRASLRHANLQGAHLVETNFTDADLTGCAVYAVSAWGLTLVGTKQQNLVITPKDEPQITVDNVEVAQFIYLMLNNQKIRDVVDTVTSKAVLILGRFTERRKAVLDALRDELRTRNYLPILFDFDVPASRDVTETVSLLARMARFIIADVTEPSSIPKELETIVPHLAVPVQPLIASGIPYSMLADYHWKYHWFLPVYRYGEPDLESDRERFFAALADKVIALAEAKVDELAERRLIFQAQLMRPK